MHLLQATVTLEYFLSPSCWLLLSNNPCIRSLVSLAYDIDMISIDMISIYMISIDMISIDMILSVWLHRTGGN